MTSKARQLLNELNEANFEYFVNKDERGEFEADIRDKKGKTVWEGDTEVFREMIEDGYMKHKDDLKGLVSYLIDMKVLPRGASVSKGN